MKDIMVMSLPLSHLLQCPSLCQPSNASGCWTAQAAGDTDFNKRDYRCGDCREEKQHIHVCIWGKNMPRNIQCAHKNENKYCGVRLYIFYFVICKINLNSRCNEQKNNAASVNVLT